MKKLSFQQYLQDNNACKIAIIWNGDRSLQTCWEECERGDWMLWLMKKANMCDLKTLTLAKAKCAELVKHYVKDERSIKALQSAFDFANSKITIEELNAASVNAYEAAAVAVSAEAYEAASAVAYAVSASVSAYAVAYAVSDAAAYARINILKKCADICREVVPIPKIEGVL